MCDISSLPRHRLSLPGGWIQVTPGFLFLTALLFYRGTQEFVGGFFLAEALHEAGHIAAARLLGVPARGLSLTAFGCVLYLGGEALIPAGKLLCIAGAGPAVNLCALLLCQAFCGGKGPLALFEAENLLLALFNLLPLFPLDGAVMLNTFLSLRMLPDRAECLVSGISLVLAAASVAVAVWLGGTDCLRMLLFGLWMGAGALRKLGISLVNLSAFR